MYSLVLMMALSGSAEVPAGHGCCGGCHGCHGCNGCCGGCHGCHGGKHRKHGCHGCCGGYSCHGCCGGYSCNGCCGGYSCNGCNGGYGCNGGVVVTPVVAPPVGPGPGPDAGPKGPPAKKDVPKKEEAGNAPATIYVSLPADAKLTIDDAATASTSTTRVFATPALEQGKEYFYTLKAQVTREGKVLTATQRIAVRAGETSRIALDVPTATGVASSK